MSLTQDRAPKAAGARKDSGGLRHAKRPTARRCVEVANLVLGLVGLFIIVFGWAVDHKIGWAIKVASPEYAIASACYQSLLKEDTAVESTDRGFDELRSIIEEDLEGPGDLSIDKFRSVHMGYSNLLGGFSEPTITLEITLKDGRVREGRIVSLESRIQARYLETPLIRASGWLLWIGVILSFTALVISYRSHLVQES